MSYTSATDIREVSGIGTASLDNSELENLGTRASIQLNREVNRYHEDEKVQYIDSWRENKVNGSNSTFYIQNPPLGDYSNDFSVDSNDVEGYTVSSDGTQSKLNVSTIVDSEFGKIKTASTPNSSDTVYFSYAESPVEIAREGIQEAATLLGAYYGVRRLSGRGVRTVKLGDFSLTKGNLGKEFIGDYREKVNHLQSALDEYSVDIKWEVPK